MKKSLVVLALTAGLTIPLSLAYAAPQERQEHKEHSYHFRDQDGAKLREHYRANFRTGDHIDMGRRVHFTVGARMPDDWKTRMHPVPEVIVRELPPVPSGLEIGYLDGYAVVYDPSTAEIVEVLDVY